MIPVPYRIDFHCTMTPFHLGTYDLTRSIFGYAYIALLLLFQWAISFSIMGFMFFTVIFTV